LDLIKKIMKNCIVCNKEIKGQFYCQSCWLKKFNASKKGIIKKPKSYCKKCKKELSKRKYQYCNQCKPQTGKDNPNYKHGLTIKENYCINCGNKLKGNQAYKHKRCGNCYQKFKKQQNHPNWRGGSSYEPYSSKFTDELKNQIRKRDNCKCQLCGLSEKENIKSYKHKLNVHHIDYDKQNCNFNNLVSLCNSCHMKTHYNREKWTKLFKREEVLI